MRRNTKGMIVPPTVTEQWNDLTGPIKVSRLEPCSGMPSTIDVEGTDPQPLLYAEDKHGFLHSYGKKGPIGF